MPKVCRTLVFFYIWNSYQFVPIFSHTALKVPEVSTSATTYVSNTNGTPHQQCRSLRIRVYYKRNVLQLKSSILSNASRIPPILKPRLKIAWHSKGQWLSNARVPNRHLESLGKHRMLGPTSTDCWLGLGQAMRVYISQVPPWWWSCSSETKQPESRWGIHLWESLVDVNKYPGPPLQPQQRPLSLLSG